MTDAARETPPNAGADAPTAASPALPASLGPAGVPAVFVSHSSRNADAAMSIVNALEAAGVACWVAPRDIPAGADYNGAIMAGINACRAMVLVFTRYSAESDPVAREVERVLNRRMPVIPVRLEQAAPSPALEFMISTSQWVDAFPPPLDRCLDAVVAAVKKALHLDHAVPRPDPNAPPTYVGPYRILEPLGQGGMGAVYRAEQRSPVKRTVAVKVIKPGFDSAEVIARFESERQALARMDHPNVARVLDAGADALGRPYFVMEYVPGVPMTEYADSNKLSVRQRLELFTQACDAIAHAHTKALIHRDIKASNVLAYTADGKPRVKVIDFGIAKALTGDRLTDRTLNTQRGQAIGTYESMSPEQADGSPDIDTRTDVYSLGVLLYEMLAGAKPFDKQSLANAAEAEVRRIIREVEPPRPSTRLSSLGEAGMKIAAARRAPLEGLARELRSELEWIPMMAMRKERERRYPSPLALSADIGRYLSGLPLTAGPESGAYRLRKFVGRHRTALLAATAALLLLAGGTSAYVRGIRAEQAKTERALAETDKQKHVADQQRDAARESAAAARRRLIDIYLRDGWARVDAGDPSVALLWFAKALEASETPEEQEDARIRFGTTLGVAPRLLDMAGGVEARHDALFGGRAVRLNGNEVEIVDAATGQPLSPPLNHESSVSFADPSPDGRRFVTLCKNTARVWDFATAVALTPPLKHEAVVFAAFSPDGRLLITAGNDNTARVWDIATGQPVTPPLKHANKVRYAAFSFDGRRCVTASADTTARVWDAATGAPITPPLTHQENVYSARFSPDSHRVVTASADNTARIWDAVTGAAVTPPLRHESGVYSARFSPDGRRVVTASADRTARVWDSTTGQPLSPPLKHDDAVLSAMFSPGGERVATVSRDGAVRVWDAATGRPLTPPLKHARGAVFAVFSLDGRRVITASRDTTERDWDAGVGQPSRPPTEQARMVNFAAFSPDCGRVIIGSYKKTNVADADARVWDVASGQPLTPPLKHEGNICSATFSPDGRRVVTASGDKTARVWDAATGRPLTPPLKHQDIVMCAAFSPDGRRVVTASFDKTARVWDAATGEPLTPPLKHDGPVDWAVFSPDGRHVVTAGGTARVWDAATGQPLTPPLNRDQVVNFAAFSPDGRCVVTATTDGTARVWDAATGKPLTPPMKHDRNVSCAVFSPDGGRVVTSSSDGTARVWDVATGQPLTPPLRHEDVSTASFSFDGRRVITMSQQAARVWDAFTGQPLTPPLEHVGDAQFLSAALTPDGRRLVTASDDETARVWEIASDPRPPHDLTALAELLAAERVDASGGLANLTAQEWRSRWDRLRRLYPEQFRPTPQPTTLAAE